MEVKVTTSCVKNIVFESCRVVVIWCQKDISELEFIRNSSAKALLLGTQGDG